jgi:hypothetical protein
LSVHTPPPPARAPVAMPALCGVAPAAWRPLGWGSPSLVVGPLGSSFRPSSLGVAPLPFPLLRLRHGFPAFDTEPFTQSFPHRAFHTSLSTQSHSFTQSLFTHVLTVRMRLVTSSSSPIWSPALVTPPYHNNDSAKQWSLSRERKYKHLNFHHIPCHVSCI